MSIHVINIRWDQTSPFHRRLHSAETSITIISRGSNMMRVTRHPITFYFGINFCAASFGMFQFFQHNDAGTFTHHKAVTTFVPWT